MPIGIPHQTKDEVVRRNADGEREIALMSWRFLLLQNGRAARR
jgi:hypothetical protein